MILTNKYLPNRSLNYRVSNFTFLTGRPNKPRTIESVCEVTRARVQWKSSFNGGDHQSFTVIALNGHDIESKSDIISDKGENEIHSKFIQNLKPSTPYVFYVSARNSFGFSSSENISCTTLEGKNRQLGGQ